VYQTKEHNPSIVQASGSSLPTFLQSEVAALKLQVDAASLDKIKNQRVNLGQILAERRQTAQLVWSSVTRIAKAVAYAKKGVARRALSSLLPKGSRGLASDYLAFQFGVKPLLSDIDGILQKLAENNAIEFDIVVARTRSGVLPFQNTGSSSTYVKVSSGYEATWAITVKNKYRIRVSSEGLHLASSLGLLNIADLAWELTPWSFVIDWFYPIGSYLNRLDAQVGITVLYGHQTTFAKWKVLHTSTYGGITTTGSKRSASPEKKVQLYSEHVSCQRVLKTTLPSPPKPTLVNPYSDHRALLSLALLRQRFK